MAQKKKENKKQKEQETVQASGDNLGGQRMLGHHREESPEEREPETYHFSREDLDHWGDRFAVPEQ